MPREIPLTKGYVALVDDEDFERVSAYSWRALKQTHTVYAMTTVAGKSVYLHRLITGAPVGVKVDHRDRNGLNNTRSNLRFATEAQNHSNRGPRPGSTSRFKGVARRKRRWQAQIIAAGRYQHIGTFDNEEDAARAYDAKAKELHGEFAFLNFPSRKAA